MNHTHHFRCPGCGMPIHIGVAFGSENGPNLPEASVKIVPIDWNTPGGFITSYLVVDELKHRKQECLTLEEAEKTQSKWLAEYPFEQRRRT